MKNGRDSCPPAHPPQESLLVSHVDLVFTYSELGIILEHEDIEPVVS